MRSFLKWTAACLLAFAAGPAFYLTARDQCVALFEASTGRWQLTDTPVSMLPPDDQQALRRGIPLDSRQAAAAALEDYCS